MIATVAKIDTPHSRADSAGVGTKFFWEVAKS